MTSAEISKLSDCDLRRKLREYGTHPGPITGTTRKVYEMQFLKLISEDDRSSECLEQSVDSKSESELKLKPKGEIIPCVTQIPCTRMDTTNDKDSGALIKFNLRKVKRLSDKKLRQKFLSIGRVCGPLTETTRSVHEDLMARLSLEGSHSDALFDESFEEARLGWSDDGEAYFALETFHSFEEQHLNYFIDNIREKIIEIDSVDLRDVGNSEYDGIRTALALYDGQCQQRSKNERGGHSKPKQVRQIGIVQNPFLEAKYSLSLNQLFQKCIKYKEVFAYHATALENVPNIIRNNLNPNYPVAHGRRFGHGCYFSEYPEFSVRYGRECLLVFKILLVLDHDNRYKSDDKGFCEQIFIKDPNLFRPIYVLYF